MYKPAMRWSTKERACFSNHVSEKRLNGVKNQSEWIKNFSFIIAKKRERQQERSNQYGMKTHTNIEKKETTKSMKKNVEREKDAIKKALVFCVSHRLWQHTKYNETTFQQYSF